MNITAKEARETNVFFIQPHYYQSSFFVGNKQFSHPKVGDYSIEESSLYEFVMASAPETTSPDGVERKLHISEKEQQCSCWNDKDESFDPKCKKCYMGTEVVYAVYEWGPSGRGKRLLTTCDTEDEACDYIFEHVYKYYFISDDQRDTRYFNSRKEAEEALSECFAELWHVDQLVAASILRKSKMVEKLRAEKVIRQKAEFENRVHTLALEYADLIEPKNESYKETTIRLKTAIGGRIESAVFHAACRIIRYKYSNEHKINL